MKRLRGGGSEPPGSAGSLNSSPDADVQHAHGEQSIRDFDCPICLELTCDPVVGVCGHVFCRHCLQQWEEHSAKRWPLVRCPVCKEIQPRKQPGVCLTLASAIEAAYPEAAAKRKQEVREHLEELQAFKRQELANDAQGIQLQGPWNTLYPGTSFVPNSGLPSPSRVALPGEGFGAMASSPPQQNNVSGASSSAVGSVNPERPPLQPSVRPPTPLSMLEQRHGIMPLRRTSIFETLHSIGSIHDQFHTLFNLLMDPGHDGNRNSAAASLASITNPFDMLPAPADMCFTMGATPPLPPGSRRRQRRGAVFQPPPL